MNTITISGRITKDIELKKTKNDNKYTYNTIAVKRDKEKTDFIDFACWNNEAQYLSNYGKKGDKVLISGNLQVGKYESNGQQVNKYVVMVRQIELLSTNKKEESKQEEKVVESADDFNITEDDLPF